MKVLVIGGSGFIGSHIVDRLLAQRHGVRVFDRAAEAFRPTPPGAELQIGQLSDGPALATALAGVDCVIHAASTTVPSTSNLDPVADIEGNLIGNVRLLKLMRDSGVRHIVYLSSGGTVYGPPDTEIVREDHPLRPISSYGIVKAAFEHYLLAERHLHGLQPLILRPSNPYGPRQGLTGVQGVIGTYLRAALTGEPLQVWGDGSIVRDFFHVEDLAALCVTGMEAGAQGVFNAGSGTGHSILDVVTAVRDVTGTDAEVRFTPGRGFDVPKIVLDIGAVREALGWAPRIDLRDGIAATWDWLRAQTP